MKTKLQAKNLMVGDLVNIYAFPNEDPSPKDLFPAQITSILTPTASESFVDSVECKFKSKDGGIGFASRPADTCLPIPLTEEILVKNGFEKDDYYLRYIFYFDNRRLIRRSIEIVPQDEDWSEIEMTICSDKADINSVVEYVHELQHALRLCGIDKEIIIENEPAE